MIDSRFASDRTIDGRQQRGGNLGERQPARVGRRDKARRIADDSTTDRDYQRAAIGTHRDQPVVDFGDNIERLRRFTRRQHLHFAAPASGQQAVAHRGRVRRHEVGIGDNQR